MGVPLLLVHLVMIFGSLGVLALCALRLWRQIKATKSAAFELKDRAADLGNKVSELAERLESVDVAARLAANAR
ncbi:hypothetical protein [Parafrankia sp. EUN1f]|uniref:hypothetical protein n=1 Tax=Parafrankia sp. EUN1f TaxID=102897 RepID=UPI0001C44A01|nr:hypothetical protein [Parafrankia sp. EUN1f]EFC85264.1 hypothetical protein FrEUN1fDRAFT_1566 [Parafrankia sp. EUN1f]